MSYTIFYDKQFIKVDDNHVIPFILHGDNNVYEHNNKKRARDWGNSCSNTGGKIIVSNTDLLANIDAYRDRVKMDSDAYAKEHGDDWLYNDKAWGYHVGLAMYGQRTRTTTFAQYRNFHKNGVKKAMTIEELRDAGVTITISPYRWVDEDITNKGLEIKPDVTFISTKHMIDTIEQYEGYYSKKVPLYLRECGMDWFKK